MPDAVAPCLTARRNAAPMPNMGHGRSFLVHGRGYGGAAARPPAHRPRGRWALLQLGTVFAYHRENPFSLRTNKVALL